MRRHADSRTHFEHGARRAAWSASRADVLAERYEQAVQLDPVALWKLFMKHRHRLFGRRGVDISPAIDDAMNMNIDADIRLIAGDSQNQAGALGTDAAKLK